MDANNKINIENEKKKKMKRKNGSENNSIIVFSYSGTYQHSKCSLQMLPHANGAIVAA